MSDAGSGYRFSQDDPADGWTRVVGGDLPVPVEIRFNYAPDGRLTVVGLRLGAADPASVEAEITSATIRQIKLSDIKAAFYDWKGAWLQTFAPDEHGLTRAITVGRTVELRPPPTRGPDNESLHRFADEYRTELARQPHRAMSAAAKALNISRATANRWATLCRELGYLHNPNEGKETDASDQGD